MLHWNAWITDCMGSTVDRSWSGKGFSKDVILDDCILLVFHRDFLYNICGHTISRHIRQVSFTTF